MTKYLSKEPFSTPPATDKYRSGYDRTFGPPRIIASPPAPKARHVSQKPSKVRRSP